MATPALRIRIAPKFPAKIQGSGGVTVSRSGGTVTIGGISTNAENANFTPTLAVNFIRGIGDKLRDVKHIKDFDGFDPSGATDGAAALNYALSRVYADGAGDLVIDGGGKYLLSGEDILVPENCTLRGPHRNFGERSGRDYSGQQGLLLNASRTIRLNGRGAGVEGLAILRQGLTAPSTLRDAVTLVSGFAGTAITFGDGATMNLASDGFVRDCFIAGFAKGVHVYRNERPVLEHIVGDNLTGIHTSQVYDMMHLNDCHMWPFLTARLNPASYAVTGAANNGAGLIRLTFASHGFVTGDIVPVRAVGGTVEANGRWTVTVISATQIDLQGSTFVNAYTSGGFAALTAWRRSVGYFLDDDSDWGQAQGCFAYGYDIGFDVYSCDHGELVNCGADNLSSLLDPTPIGIRLREANAWKIIGPKTAAQGRGIVVDIGANRSATIIGHDAWGNNVNNLHQVSGHVTLVGQQASSGTSLSGASNLVDSGADGICAYANRADATVATPISASGGALRKSRISGNDWTDLTHGDQTVYNNAVSTAKWSRFGTGFVALIGQNARGSATTPTVSQSGDVGIRLGGQVYDGSAFGDLAWLRCTARGAASAGSTAGAWIFSTTPVGSMTPVDRVMVSEAGHFFPIASNTHDNGASGFVWRNTYSTNFRPGSGTATWTSGAGTPEGSVTASVGSLYTRTDGGAATTLYIKESGSGNTGWVAK